MFTTSRNSSVFRPVPSTTNPSSSCSISAILGGAMKGGARPMSRIDRPRVDTFGDVSSARRHSRQEARRSATSSRRVLRSGSASSTSPRRDHREDMPGRRPTCLAAIAARTSGSDRLGGDRPSSDTRCGSSSATDPRRDSRRPPERDPGRGARSSRSRSSLPTSRLRAPLEEKLDLFRGCWKRHGYLERLDPPAAQDTRISPALEAPSRPGSASAAADSVRRPPPRLADAGDHRRIPARFAPLAELHPGSERLQKRRSDRRPLPGRRETTAKRGRILASLRGVMAASRSNAAFAPRPGSFARNRPDGRSCRRARRPSPQDRHDPRNLGDSLRPQVRDGRPAARE